jgi:hypothetical protein
MSATDTTSARFGVEHFAAFWDAPDLSKAALVLADDVTGDWPGDPEPVRGVDAYVERIAAVLDEVPDLRLDVLEHAQNDDVLFIHWLATGTGKTGRFEFDGVDRIKIGADGKVAENVIRYDTARFAELVG